MRTFAHLKFFSLILVVVLLTTTINGVLERAHAMQSHLTVAGDPASPSDDSASHQCPCAPLEQHNDCDDCDTCSNCASHAPLASRPLQLSYNPTILDDLYASATFNFLPEVYLSLFVPPDSAAA